MVSSDFDTILKLLPQLDVNQLRQVRARVDLLSSSDRLRAKLTSDQSLLYSVLIDFLREKHIPFLPSQESNKTIPRMRGFDYKEFIECHEVLTDFQHAYFGCLKGPRLYAYYRLMLYCAESYISLQNYQGNKFTPLGFKALMNVLKDPYQVIEHSFPGYLSSGSMFMLLKNFESKEK